MQPGMPEEHYSRENVKGQGYFGNLVDQISPGHFWEPKDQRDEKEIILKPSKGWGAGWRQDNENRSNQESKFGFLATC